MIFRILLCLVVWISLVQNVYASGHIKLKTLVNGKPVDLVLDTKTEEPVLFAHAAKRIGLSWTPAKTPPAPGRVASGRSEVTEFDTGSGVRPFVFNVVDLPRYQQAGIDGVLSWSSIDKNMLLLDGERRQFSAIAALPEWAKDWKTYPINKTSYSLIMDAGKTRVLINTANDGGVMLTPVQWEKWTHAHADAPYTLKSYSTPVKPVAIGKVFHADKFLAGTLPLTNVLLENDTGVSDAGNEYDVSLGLEALAHLIIIVDGPNDICYVKASDPVPELPAYNRLGAVFVPEDIQRSDKLVAVVGQPSPAARAGIENGDELIRVNDMDVTQWRSTPGILPLSRFWQMPAGTRLALEILRGGSPRTIQVTLEDIL